MRTYTRGAVDFNSNEVEGGNVGSWKWRRGSKVSPAGEKHEKNLLWYGNTSQNLKQFQLNRFFNKSFKIRLYMYYISLVSYQTLLPLINILEQTIFKL